MSEYRRLRVEDCIDKEAGCFYRYVYGKEDIFDPHWHDFYEIFITISGTVIHKINGKTQNLPEGSLVFIRPDDRHGYVYDTPQSKKTVYVNLAFTRETAQSLFEYLSDGFPYESLVSCNMPPTVQLANIEKQRLFSQISELNAVNWSDKKALKLRVRVILADIFARYFSKQPEENCDKMPLWLSEILETMKKPENFIAGAGRMTELCSRSREHLMRCMMKYCGFTVSEYINELRLNYAANMLLRTNSPILEICFSCGFQSSSYFYKAFNEKYRMSPSKFRTLFG